MIARGLELWHGLRNRAHTRLLLRLEGMQMGPGCVIDRTTVIDHPELVRMGRDVHIWRYGWIQCLPGRAPSPEPPRLVVGDGAYVGNGCHISCAREVSIGAGAVLADRVYVSDVQHSVDEVDKHLFQRPLRIGRVIIGEGAWVGEGACVFHDVRIGRNCVVGANAVVTKDVPDDTMVAGAPARAIKTYDRAAGRWRSAAEPR